MRGRRKNEKSEKQKLEHDTLLKEVHNIDHISEMHSQIALAIMAALIIFSSYQLKSPLAVLMISLIGFCITIVWILKIIRHRKIFRTCYKKLTDLERLHLHINALRPLPDPPKKLLSFDGFTLLIWLGIIFIVFWVALPLISHQISLSS